MSAKHAPRCPTCNRTHRRSNPQNALYWLLLHELAEKVRPGGQSYSAETWHTYCKSRFLGCDDVKLPNGKTLSMPRSTAGLDVAEFGIYFEMIQVWAGERGVFLDSLEAA